MTETVSGQGRNGGGASVPAGRGRPRPRGASRSSGSAPRRGPPLRRGELGAPRRRHDELADGSINFEQRGVEFPDFWCVNAANIVTTQVLPRRGGHAAREWSLAQLIDRVVKTYRKAGEEHGYFASPTTPRSSSTS